MCCYMPKMKLPLSFSFETYVWTVAWAVEAPKIVAAFRHYDKGVFYLAMWASHRRQWKRALQWMGLLEVLEELGTRILLLPPSAS